MHRACILSLTALAAVALTACGERAHEQAGQGPGAVSEGEARALEKAAQMLDEQRLPENSLPDVSPAETETETATEPDQAQALEPSQTR